MTESPGIVLERIECAIGECEVDNSSAMSESAIKATGFAKRFVAAEGTDLFSLSMSAVGKLPSAEIPCVKGVVAATFSNPDRFPSLAVRIAAALKLPSSVPAFDLQLACSAYPYALYVAANMARDLNGRVLVVDGDVQSRLSRTGNGTGELFSDAASATIVAPDPVRTASFAFLSEYSRALECPSAGPVAMDGFGVFSFVATKVTPFLREFAGGGGFDWFVPHQANMYMVRRLADSLELAGKLVACGEKFGNAGSASIPLSISLSGKSGRMLLAGFGAGFSASAAIVSVSPEASGKQFGDILR